MVYRTPEKAKIVKALLSAMSTKESAVTVKARMSSEIDGQDWRSGPNR